MTPTSDDLARDAEADLFELDKVSPHLFAVDLDWPRYANWLRTLAYAWIRRAKAAEVEIPRLQRQIEGHCERIAAAHDVIAKNAERRTHG